MVFNVSILLFILLFVLFVWCLVCRVVVGVMLLL